VHRPAPFIVPAPALRLALGEFADEGALVSQRVLPDRLTKAGFTFRHPDIDTALASVLA
jgi:NAD dependent epimerase/dehydratase family enzyme